MVCACSQAPSRAAPRHFAALAGRLQGWATISREAATSRPPRQQAARGRPALRGAFTAGRRLGAVCSFPPTHREMWGRWGGRLLLPPGGLPLMQPKFLAQDPCNAFCSRPVLVADPSKPPRARQQLTGTRRSAPRAGQGGSGCNVSWDSCLASCGIQFQKPARAMVRRMAAPPCFERSSLSPAGRPTPRRRRRPPRRAARRSRAPPRRRSCRRRRTAPPTGWPARSRSLPSTTAPPRAC